MSRFGSRLFGAVPVGQWLQARGANLIESIQANTIAVTTGTGSNTRAISAVDTTRTMLLHLGTSYNISGSILTGPMCRIALTNSTTVTATDVVTADGATATVSFVAIQFKTGVIRSIQRGTVTQAAGTATLTTSVDTSKAFVNLLGYSTSSDDNRSMVRLALTNATTVTITGTIAGATASYEVIEFS